MHSPLIPSKDKFGFYTVGEFKTYSKVEAIELSNRTGKTLSWNFNNIEFSTYNWTVEPVESLRELYGRRAQEIRASYDYIVVWWSGGADSYTVLKSFVDNNLFVDEIATFHNYGGDGSWDSYLNSEVHRVAMPVAQKLMEHSPNTRFRLIDLTDYESDLFAKDNNRFDFLYKSNAQFSPNQMARRYIREREKDYLDLFDQGKRVCFVWGCDKPRVWLQPDNRYAIRFVDVADNCVNPMTQMLNRSWEIDEFFYWSPDAKDLLCKQGHEMVRYLRNIPANDFNSRWVSTEPNWLGNAVVNGQSWYLTNDGVHRIIYPDWNADTYTSGKHNFLLMWSPRDNWFLNDVNSEQYKIYRAGLEKLANIAGNRWLRPGKGIDQGLQVCLSPPLYLE